MTYNSAHSRKVASDAGFRVFRFVVLCLLLLPALLLCPGCLKPPDLTGCNRLEIQCPDGALIYFFGGGEKEPIFSRQEKQYIGSFDTWVVKDQDIIKAFARDVSRGSYRGQLPRGFTSSPGLKIICYRNGERIASFEAWYREITTEDDKIFKYPRKVLDLSMLDPPEIRPFMLRYQCKFKISRLCNTFGGLLLREREKVSSYPDPNQWCDAVVKVLQNPEDFPCTYWGPYSDTDIAKVFTCLSARESTKAEDTDARPSDPNLTKRIKPLWESHFAMNPNCEPNSPPDTVLLFETKAGWNQYGGPELFTFDNHDPRGGVVRLNDDTVKFIRTREELQQLRWK